MVNIQLKMSEITFFVQNEEKYSVFHDNECNCIFVREENGQLLLAWKWLIRAIWFCFRKHVESGGLPNQKDDVLIEFESSGNAIQVNITKFGCITREGSQLLNFILDPEMQNIVNAIIRMPDSDHKNVIKLFTDLSFMNDLIVHANSNANISQNSKGSTPPN